MFNVVNKENKREINKTHSALGTLWKEIDTFKSLIFRQMNNHTSHLHRDFQEGKYVH